MAENTASELLASSMQLLPAATKQDSRTGVIPAIAPSRLRRSWYTDTVDCYSSTPIQ
jgi:hypothetical protein